MKQPERWPRLAQRLRAFGGGGLALRIVAMSLLLLLALQAAAWFVVRSSIDKNARGALTQELAVGERIWRRLLEQRVQTLTQGATLLAADFGLLSSLIDGDQATVRSALDNAGSRMGAAVTALLDRQLVPTAVGERADPNADAALRQVAQDLARQASVLVAVAGRPYQFVRVPMRGAGAAGSVAMGFALDQALLQDMRSLSGLHVVLAHQSDAGLSVMLSTLEGSIGLSAASRSIDINGEEFLVRRIALTPGMSVLLLHSVDSVMAPYRQLRELLGAIALIGLVLFALGSLATARRVTTPLQRLVGASEHLGRGDYTVALRDTDRADEIGELARAFDHMRHNIATHASEIRTLAFNDRLTGMPNRAHFREAVQHAIDTAGPGAGVAVVMLDLDRFKHVNDVLGYATGDRLLKAVTLRLTQDVVRQGDLVARLGGDEFALLLPATDMANALAVAGRIARSFEQPLTLDDQTVDLSAGVGIAHFPEHASDADTLMSRAEVAMYAAKRRLDVAVVYDPAIDLASAQTLSLLSELRRAVELGELRLFLQPKLRLSDQRLVGAEALVRWQHPTRGLVPPLEFIPFAEQTGFVRKLTLWAFEEAAQMWTKLQAGGPFRIAINLSTRDLMDLELPAKLGAILERHAAPAAGFCLEITESAIMDDPERAALTLDALSQRGFRLSIDDFGTGYSSLAYLKRLPVDELKIDKSFVMSMTHDSDDAQIVRSTIELAHNLQLSVVAEGVENAQVLAQLRALRCDEAQGYHFSRPVALAAFEVWMQRWSDQTLEAADTRIARLMPV